ncbi:TPA: DNA-binding protein [Clostridium perfringens]
MRTAQDVANELNITRSEVYNLLRKKRFSPLVQKKGGQVAISNKLFNLLKEEVENKRSLENENNITIKEPREEILSNVNEISSDKAKLSDKSIENNIDPVQILRNQIELKDNQINILNNVITNNLKRISELEEKQINFKTLSDELELLKKHLNEISKRKNKKRILGLF